MLKFIDTADKPVNDQGNRNNNELARNPVCIQNANAARAVADIIRTSLGPTGLDKLIEDGDDVLITNDGATILKKVKAKNSAAKILVELSKSQDIEVGDGTTSVVILAGSFISAAVELLEKGIHPQTISSYFIEAKKKCLEILDDISIEINKNDAESIKTAVKIALQTKVVSSLAEMLTSIAFDAVMACRFDDFDDVNLDNIKIVKVLGGTLENSEFVKGLVLNNQKISRIAGGPVACKNAKIGLIQFFLSIPKTNLDQQITIRDYSAIDRILKQEKAHIIKMIRVIKNAGCNVLLIQKSILRDAVTDLSLDLLAKAGIMVIRDIEREDIELISKSLGCEPISSIEYFTESRLGYAENVFEEVSGGSRIIKFLGSLSNKTVSVVLHASNSLVLEEADRSFRDAICIVRSLIRKNKLLAGAGAVEIELATKLRTFAFSIPGIGSTIIEHYANAFDVIPYTLAENAGLRPIEFVTKLKAKHEVGLKNAGLNLKKGCICDDVITELEIIQPYLVTKSIIGLSTECVQLILRIDDIVLCK